MTRPSGKPWEAPGFRFSISWPPGYETEQSAEASLQDTLSAAGKKGGKSTASTQVTDNMRAGGMEALPRGRGTLGSLSKRTEAERAKSDKLRRGVM